MMNTYFSQNTNKIQSTENTPKPWILKRLTGFANIAYFEWNSMNN